MWTSHKTSSASVRPSFTRHDLCRSVTMSIESLRTTSHLQIEKSGLTLLCSNPKHANGSKPTIAERTFKRLRKMCGVRRPDTFSFQPRIHDLRHTFAVHRVTEWYRQGADVQKLLPALSTYLGHVSLESTQRYLTITPELLQQANNRFERYATGGAQ